MGRDATTPPTTPVKPRARLRLHPVAFAFALVPIGVALFLPDLSTKSGWEQALPERVGMALAAMVIPALPAILGYYVARRSNLVFNIVFVLFLNLQTAAMLAQASASRSARVNGAEQRIRAISSAARDDARRQLDEAGSISPNLDALKESAAILRSEANKMPGDKAVTPRVLADAMEAMQESASLYNNDTSRFDALGGLDLSTLHDGSGLGERIEALEAMKVSNDHFRETLRGLPDRIRNGLREAGTGEAERDRNAAAFAKGAKLDLLDKMRATDDLFIAAALDHLKFLKGRQGHWSYTAEENRITFDTQSDIDSYRRTKQVIDETVAEQQRLQRLALSGTVDGQGEHESGPK